MNRLSTHRVTTIPLLGTALFASTAPAQTAKDLIGAWTLVSDENVRADGSRVQVMGPNPQGLLIFDADGRYSLQLLRPGRPKFGSNNRMEGTPEENKAAVQGANPHWGTYSVNEADRTFVLHMEGSTFPNFNGVDQKRLVKAISANELDFTSPTSPMGGISEFRFLRDK